MNTSNVGFIQSIKRWEEAGASLLAAFKNYAEICNNLGVDSLNDGVKPEDLASQIDSVLETMHVALSNQLAKATSTLSRTRNKLASPMLRFPEEVLSHIFTNVVFDYHNPDALCCLPMRESVKYIYKHLRILCRVCCAWRIIVVTRGTLWSVIPIVEYPRVASGLSLQRAGESPLHLAALLSGKLDELYDILGQHGSRFRTINLDLPNYSSKLIGEVFTRIVPYGASGSLSELSAMYSNGTRSPDRNDEYETSNPELKGDSYIFPLNSPHISSFNNLLRSLTAFRICRINLHWGDLAFSSRLVKLRIEEVKLGYDDAIVPFLQALSSASELRNLKIIAIKTYHRSNPIPSVNALPIVAFPRLRALLLEGLYLNTLKLLLAMIAPGPHRLTLSLDWWSTRLNIHRREESIWAYEDRGEDDPVDIQEQWLALGPIQVDTLRIGQQGSLSGPMLRNVLSTMPTLKTLQLHQWVFSRNRLDQSLCRLHDVQVHLFPTLENLYLTEVTINDDKPFQEIVTNHPLQQVIIGGKVRSIDSGGTAIFEPLQEGSDLVLWLRNNVPNVRLVRSDYCPAHFDPQWRLW